jgi:hypothetical protein
MLHDARPRGLNAGITLSWRDAWVLLLNVSLYPSRLCIQAEIWIEHRT